MTKKSFLWSSTFWFSLSLILAVIIDFMAKASLSVGIYSFPLVTTIMLTLIVILNWIIKISKK